MPIPTAMSYVWRELPQARARVENPGLRQPLSLIVDDPNPGYNPAYFHLGFRHGPARVPRELIDQFADLIERTGIRGKFSVIPNPFGLGRVDSEVQGLSRADVSYFLDVVRARIAPSLDITPEVLTHWNAVDLSSGCLLPYWEHVWSREQNRESLLPYLSLALEILNSVDLPCSGMTSPWDFGDGVEDEYAEALLAAQRRVNGRSLTWYFLQSDGASPYVPPRLSVLRPERREAVVSIVACDTYDFGRGVWTGGEPDPDVLITADGCHGRLAEVLAAGGPGVFHTHWQTLFSGGRSIGMDALGEVVRRVADRFGDRVSWTRCSDLAAYAAASAAVEVEAQPSHDGDAVLRVTAPFASSLFTLSVALEGEARSVRLDGEPLREVDITGPLYEGAYAVADGRLYLCWALRDDHEIRIETV